MNKFWKPVYVTIQSEYPCNLVGIHTKMPEDTNGNIIRIIGYGTPLEEVFQLFNNEDAMRVIAAFAAENP